MYADILINSLLCTICGLMAFSGFAGAAAGLAFTMALFIAGLLIVDISRLIMTLVQQRSLDRSSSAHSSRSKFDF